MSLSFQVFQPTICIVINKQIVDMYYEYEYGIYLAKGIINIGEVRWMKLWQWYVVGNVGILLILVIITGISPQLFNQTSPNGAPPWGGGRY
jgi:hypothetical protein